MDGGWLPWERGAGGIGNDERPHQGVFDALGCRRIDSHCPSNFLQGVHREAEVGCQLRGCGCRYLRV
jgi:hypothetical protein